MVEGVAIASRGGAPSIFLSNITKAYGETVALSGVSLDLRTSEVHALLGENGAGKTTLMKILYGLTQPDSGQIKADGVALQINSPRDARAAGIGMVTQHFSLVKNMTVVENIALASAKTFSLDLDSVRDAVVAASARYGLEVPPDSIIGSLPIGLQQRVEILKALMSGCSYLILDEPTAVLGPQDIDSLLDVIARLRSEAKIGVVLISHKMAEIEKVADRVSVLRRGKVVSSSLANGITSKELITLMVGEQESGVVLRSESQSHGRDPILVLDSVVVKMEIGGLNNVSLDVRPGEIVGIAGVSGNGQTELVNILSGTLSIDSGTIAVEGATLTQNTPQLLMRAGVGMLGEDRHASAVHALQVMENLVLDCVDNFATKVQLNRKKMLEHCESAINQFEIKATAKQVFGTLSGGNMQKVLLARLFSRKPKVAIISQPTRGLDVMATSYVRSLISKARLDGTAVLLVSEDLDEVLELADRVAVMYRGSVIGVVDGANASREKIGELMAGIVR
ncbi:MAG: ABC transporter ATP-binding protein [Actinobacteria bacterium]|nr:ABC transporter ATP-binding protein [Actinomycetota bacterium]